MVNGTLTTVPPGSRLNDDERLLALAANLGGAGEMVMP
jgi:hypothetical protein